MSCMSPCAPAPLPAFGLKLDSCLITPRISAGSTPYFLAAASISFANGVGAPGPAPEAAVAPVAAAADGSAAPVAWSSALAKVVLPWAGAAAGAAGVGGGVAGLPGGGRDHA